MEQFMSKLRTRFPDLRRRIPVSPQRAADETRLESASANERLNRLSDLRIHTDAVVFSSSKPHGSGGKAEVVKATYKRGHGSDKQQVAVKKLRYYNEINKRKFGNEFVDEVDIMAGLSHENIIKLIGFVEDLQDGKAWIVLSWEPNGNVSEFLATGEWEIPERISLIKDTFAGIKYLHTRQPPICHGDLKSLNILVSASYRAIITDFGSARVVRETEDRQEERDRAPDVTGASATDESVARTEIAVVASGNRLTLTGPAWSLRWAAPEVALGEKQNLASDIWAAGWVCWEIITNKVPFPELNGEGAITLKVIQGEVPATHEDIQLSQMIRLCSLMTDCWEFDPQNRPNIARCISEVVQMPGVPPSHSKMPSATLLLQMGRIQKLHGNYQKAISLLEQAVSAAMSAGDQKTSAKASERLGRTYYLMSKYVEAEQHLTLAKEIYASIGNDLGQASALQHLAQMYRAQHKLSKAEEFYNRARNIYSHAGNGNAHADTLRGLGNICRQRSQYPEAEEFYNQAKDIFTRRGNDQGRATTLLQLGALFRDQCEYTRAEEVLNQALDIYSRIGDKSGRAEAMRVLSDVDRERGLNTKAALLLAEARSLYAQIGDSKSEKYCSHWLDVMSKQGDVDSFTTSPPIPRDPSVPCPGHQQ